MANTICVRGKIYPVIHKKIEKDHNFSKTFYDYRENDNTYIVYSIEFTRNQAVYDAMGDVDFDFDWYDIMQYDNIDDAIKTFVRLRYDDTVLFVHMFTSVYHNGKIVLEECKDMCMESILDKPTLKRLENAEKSAKIYQEKYERLQKFVDMYHLDDLEIDRRLQANNK
jgi:hypothetical protein